MKKLSPLKSIRLKCLDCCCDSPKEVKLCEITDCILYTYRFGKNPNRKNKGNPEALKRFREKSLTQHSEKPQKSTDLSNSADHEQ